MKSRLFEPAPAPAETSVAARRISIGLPANRLGGKRCFPLTPEAVRHLVDNSCDNDVDLSVIVESGAPRDIHYTDARYARCGAAISDRNTVLKADIIITSTSLDISDIALLRKGAMWITLIAPERIEAETLQAAVKKHITVISLMQVTDSAGNCHIADTLAEVDGRAAIAVSVGILADGANGKGILLGGVAGIIPCEVIVIGAGTAGIAAAKSAVGAGAIAHIFDDDSSRLRYVTDTCSGTFITSSLHREVFLRAITKADIIINTLPSSLCRKVRLSAEDISTLKNDVIIIDTAGSNIFPSLKQIDIQSDSTSVKSMSGHICLINVGNAVPRTTSMAVSNCLVPLLEKIVSVPSSVNPIKIESGLKAGLVTFGGKVVNRDAAAATGLNYVDPSIYMHLS